MDRLEGGISGGAIVFDLERLTRIPKDGERMIDLADRDTDPGQRERVRPDHPERQEVVPRRHQRRRLLL